MNDKMKILIISPSEIITNGLKVILARTEFVVDSLADVPARGVGRLVLPGRQGEHFLALYRHGRAPAAREIAFVSPPFAPKSIPQTLFASAGVGKRSPKRSSAMSYSPR